MITAFLVIVSNLLADLLYAVVDPRHQVRLMATLAAAPTPRLGEDEALPAPRSASGGWSGGGCAATGSA